MRRWEHLNIVIRFNHQTGRIRETVIEGQKKTYPPDEQPTIQQYLQELSLDGWDLGGIVGTDTYLFSRPVNGTE